MNGAILRAVAGASAPKTAPRTLTFSLRSIPGGFAAIDGVRDRAVHLDGKPNGYETPFAAVLIPAQPGMLMSIWAFVG